MNVITDTGRSGVLVLKVNEDDVNTILMNTDVDSEGLLQYAYDNFADIFSENILEYAFAYAEIPRDEITRKQREAAKSLSPQCVRPQCLRLRQQSIFLHPMAH